MPRQSSNTYILIHVMSQKVLKKLEQHFSLLALDFVILSTSFVFMRTRILAKRIYSALNIENNYSCLFLQLRKCIFSVFWHLWLLDRAILCSNQERNIFQPATLRNSKLRQAIKFRCKISSLNQICYFGTKNLNF